MSRDPDTQFQPNMGSRNIVERWIQLHAQHGIQKHRPANIESRYIAQHWFKKHRLANIGSIHMPNIGNMGSRNIVQPTLDPGTCPAWDPVTSSSQHWIQVHAQHRQHGIQKHRPVNFGSTYMPNMGSRNIVQSTLDPGTCPTWDPDTLSSHYIRSRYTVQP
jgi:hypothetical protein